MQEQIELERLVNEAHDLVTSMQERGIEMKGDQLPISAIVRCPLLAIRWQLPNKMVRRLLSSTYLKLIVFVGSTSPNPIPVE